MPTTTTNLGLTKPDIGQSSWGSLMNANLDTLDSVVAGKAAAVHTHAAADIVSGTIATSLLGSGTANSTKFLRGDQTWQTIPVTSVFGRTGAVTGSKSDVGLGNVDNTSDLNKPVSTATANALALKADASNVLPLNFDSDKTVTGAFTLDLSQLSVVKSARLFLGSDVTGGDNDEILHIWQAYDEPQTTNNAPNALEVHTHYIGTTDSNLGTLRAGYMTVELDNDKKVGFVTALLGEVGVIGGGGSTTYAVGLNGSVYMSNDAGTTNHIGTAVGGEFAVSAFGTVVGTIDTAIVIHAVGIDIEDNHTITQGYGVKIDAPYRAGTGVLTTAYGLFVDDYSAVATDYAIRVMGGISRFGPDDSALDAVLQGSQANTLFVTAGGATTQTLGVIARAGDDFAAAIGAVFTALSTSLNGSLTGAGVQTFCNGNGSQNIGISISTSIGNGVTIQNYAAIDITAPTLGSGASASSYLNGIHIGDYGTNDAIRIDGGTLRSSGKLVTLNADGQEMFVTNGPGSGQAIGVTGNTYGRSGSICAGVYGYAQADAGTQSSVNVLTGVMADGGSISGYTGAITTLAAFYTDGLWKFSGTTVDNAAGLRIDGFTGVGTTLNAGISIGDFGSDATSYAIKVDGGKIDFSASAVTALSLDVTNFDASHLPTSDPHVAGRVWNNSGVLTVSAG